MQLVIDITEEIKIQLGFGVTFSDDIQAICEAIENSTPLTDILDKIRAEIEQITDTIGVSYNQYVSKIDVLQIIDKYREQQTERSGEDGIQGY